MPAKSPARKKPANINWRGVPPDILKEVTDRRKKHIGRCGTCQYSMGKALEGYIRELKREEK